MKLAAGLCVFIGVVQVAFSHSLYGLIWVVAAAILFGIDYYVGE